MYGFLNENFKHVKNNLFHSNIFMILLCSFSNYVLGIESAQNLGLASNLKWYVQFYNLTLLSFVANFLAHILKVGVKVSSNLILIF